jgi:hypothetical protein
MLDPRKCSRGVLNIPPRRSTFHQNNSALRNTAEATGSKPFAVWLQLISGGDAVNLLVAFYDIHGRKKEMLYFYSVPDTTQDI